MQKVWATNIKKRVKENIWSGDLADFLTEASAVNASEMWLYRGNELMNKAQKSKKAKHVK